MRKSITIRVPEPCHEDWNKMTPRDKGRHCVACQKTVVDFTTLTDEQIVKTFESEGQLCGRFKKQQLNREVVLSRKDKNNYLSWAASGLLAFLALGHQEAYAQGEPKTEQTPSDTKPQVKGKTAVSVLQNHTISGNVIAESDGLPLPGANVFVKGTTRGTQTDFDGNFTIKVKKGEVLVISFISFRTKEITIDKHISLNVALEEDLEALLGEVVVGGAISYNASYPEYAPEPYISNYEREYMIEDRLKNQNKWLAKNREKRQQWKAERLAKREAIRNGEQERTAMGKFFYGVSKIFRKKHEKK